MLRVDIASFSYKNVSSERLVLKDIAFQLEKGQHLAVLGESGCGKSTLLHLIYGLLHLENGAITWVNKKLLGPNHNLIPGEPFMKLVAQEFNVMPFISVAENIATHLSRNDREKDAARVTELIQVVDLEAFKDVKIKNLSGGQKQRVALAKALAKEPELILLDEPFSNIDTFRKNKLRRNLFAYLKEKNISAISSTHDSDEALGYFDQILLLKGGKKEAFGTPKEIYNGISNAYQAGFFGEATELPASLFSSEISKSTVTLLPHQLHISEERTLLQVTVQKTYFKGRHYLIHAKFEETDVFFESSILLEPERQLFLKV